MWLPVLVDAGLLALYLTAPLDRPFSLAGLFSAVAAIGLVLVLAVRGVRMISQAERPKLRALGVLVCSFPMLILPFAALYVWLSHHGPQHFTQPVGRVGGVYFAMTVFTTVGFGDIAPRTEVAQLAVLAQMVADVAYVGLFLRVLAGVARRGAGKD